MSKRTIKADTPPFRTLTAMSTAAVAPSLRPRGRPRSRRQRSAPAACGSSTSPRPAPKPGYLPNRVRRDAHRSLLIVKGAEYRRQAAESPNQSELGSDAINGETEPHFQRKRETMLGFALHLIERIARREKVCVQVGVAGRQKIEITALVCSLERATQQIAAIPDMSRPRNQQAPKVEIDPSLEALQPPLFDQIIAEPPESKSGLVVAEVWSSDEGKHRIGQARSVTVAILEAEIDRAAADQGK